MEPSTIQKASVSASATKADQGPASSGALQPSNTERMATGRSFFVSSATLSFFQRAYEPSTIKNNTGSMMGANTELKYGGPTDNLPRLSASTISGYKVR